MEQPNGMFGSPKGEAMSAMLEEMENPAAQMPGTTSPELLIPRNLFPKDCKEGDIYTVTGTVGQVGSKVSFTPTEAFKPSVEEEAAEV